MVNAHDVALRERGAEPVAPPRVAVGGVGFPGVERVAPHLAVGGKIIRRHPGDGDGLKRCRVELEELRVGPGVGGIAGDEDREVADDLDAALLRGGAEFRPLAEEQILAEAVGVGGLGELRAQRRFLRAGEVAERGGPFPPRLAVAVILQRAEEGVSVEPVRFAAAEGRVVAVGQGGGFLPEDGGGHLQQARFEAAERLEVHVVGRERGERGEIAGGDEAGAHERGEVHEVGVAGEGRVALVGRVAVAGRAERADLPVFDPGGFEKIEEPHRVVVEDTATLRAGQGRRVEQHAGSAVS